MKNPEKAKFAAMVRAAEDCGWFASLCDGCFDLEKWSPAGEDVIFSACADSLDEMALEFRDMAADFDAEEHAGAIFLCKRRGTESERHFYRDAPDSLRDLLADAAWIAEEQRKVADAICAAAGVRVVA